MSAKSVVASRPMMIGLAATSALAVLAVILVPATEEPTRTTRVERSNVETRVSASGALAPLSSRSLGFPEGARITEIMVKVGDHVRAGQPLAKVDDFGPRQELNLKLTDLRRQQAELARVINGTGVPGADSTLREARRILEATRRSTKATKNSNQSATGRAEVQLSADRQLRDQAQRTLQQCLAAAATTSATTPSPADTATDSTSGTTGTGTTGTGTSSTGRRARRDRATATDGNGSVCQDQRSAANGADRQVISSQTALEAARKREDVDAAASRLTIANAQQGVVSAQNSANSARAERPTAVAAQRASLDAARIEVTKAQHELAKTVLTAPADGTVSSLHGQAGDVVGPATAGSALAPGSDTALPADLDSVPTGPDAGWAVTPVVVLSDLNAFQVVVPFAEADAVRIGPDRPARVTFDAIPDLTADGRVLAVAPGPTPLGGTTTYLATIALTGTDPRLRDGLTASAAVVTDNAADVLSVPNEAVVRQADRSMVTVTDPDGATRQVDFRPGRSGTDRTEVLGGLHEGQQVLVPAPGSGGQVRNAGQAR